jgi:hypothetical protein
LAVIVSNFRTTTGSWHVTGVADADSEADGETAAVVNEPWHDVNITIRAGSTSAMAFGRRAAIPIFEGT